jgi:hypothetical protein
MWLEIFTNALCLILTLGALGVAGWALLSGKVMEQGIDGLFLLTICLVIALLFSIIPLQAIRRSSLWHLLKQLRKRKPAQAAEPEEPQREPVAAEKSQGKS